MTRYKKLFLNSTTSVLYQAIALICGFILPRFILMQYGSAVNGLVSSITQFLGFISLCEMGVGSVIQSSLYKPLANKDVDEISRITISSEKFFRKIALILLVYTGVLMIVYPLVVFEDFDYFYTLLLILAISISSFAQYYFGMTYRLLLSADQYGFVNFGIRSITLILNTVILVNFDAPIHMVKLVTSALFLLQPIVISLIAKRMHKINRKVVITEEPIKQKWNGLAQHVASVVHGNVPIVVLTLFSTLENVSIYAVYHLVLNGIKNFVVALTDGMHSMIGNMLAKDEKQGLNNVFNTFEWVMHTVVTIVFSLVAALIVPFVRVYTSGLNDANYIVPVFAVVLVMSEAVYCVRIPYNILVLSAGHYKQTQVSSFIEAGIGVVISVALVFKFGLLGVAIALLVAMAYRMIYLVWYLSKNIVYRKIRIFIKHFIVDAICAAGFVTVMYLFLDFFSLQTVSYFGWFVLAMKLGIVFVCISAIVNCVFYFKMVKNIFGSIFRKFFKKKKNA